jgi:hypothetical protein
MRHGPIISISLSRRLHPLLPRSGAVVQDDTQSGRPLLRHDADVQTQRSRDDKTVAIATGLGIFVILSVMGFLILWGITSALNLSETKTSPLIILIVAASTMATVVYLLRFGKR